MFRQDNGIARRADQGCCPVILHDHDLLFRVPCARGYDGCANGLRPIMQAEGTGEKSIMEGDLYYIIMGDPGRGHKTGRQIRPHPDIVFGIADHNGFTGCPRGGMDADNFPERHSEHSIGIIEAQILFGGKGQFRQIG